MLAGVDAGEVVGKAILTEAIPANSTAPEDVAASEIRKTLNEKGVDAGLRSAAERTVDAVAFDKAIDDSIGSNRDEEGKMIRETRSKEEERYNKCKTIETTTIKYLNEGYDALNDDQKRQIKDGVEHMLLTYPALRVVYNGLQTAEREAYLERVAKDPDYSKFVAEWTRGNYDPAKIKPETISALQLEINQISERITEINKRLTEDEDNLTQRIKDLKGDIEEYQGGGSDRKEINIRRIDKMRASLTEISDRLEPLQETRTNLEERLKTLKRHKSTALQEGKDSIKIKTGEAGESITIEELSKRISQIETELSTGSKEYRDLLAKKQALESQISKFEEGDLESTLKKDLEAAEKEKKDLEKEKVDLQEKLVKKKLEIGIAKTSRTFEEEQYVKRLESVFSEAASKYFEAEIAKVNAEKKIYLEEAAKKAKTKPEEDIMLGLRDRYFPTDKEKKRIKAQQSRDDYKEIVANGSDKIITEILTAKGYDQASIDELKKDTATWNGLQEKVSTECVAFYMLRGGWFNSGGKIHPDEITKLGMTPHLEQVITKAVTRSEAIQAQIKANFGMLPEHAKMGEWIRGLDFKKLLLVLAIIAGIAGIGIFAFGKLH